MKDSMIKPKHVLMLLAIMAIAQVYHMTIVFFEEYTLQSPVVFRSPIKDRFISPVPDVTSMPIIRNTEPDIKVITPKAVPSATPTPKAQKKASSGLVGAVYASDIQPSDDEIIAYIRLKDWDDEVAIALAKSENFWNLAKSFDCSRTGAQNNNGTRDHGLWQINDIHINSGAITLEDANDCFKATDFAYGLYKGRGNTFGAWSAYTNKSYLGHL